MTCDARHRALLAARHVLQRSRRSRPEPPGNSRQALPRQHRRNSNCGSAPKASGSKRAPAPYRDRPRPCGPPVHGVGNLVRSRIKLNLLVEIFLGFFVAVLAIGQPGTLPMRVRRLVACRESARESRDSNRWRDRNPCAADTCCRSDISADSSHGDFGVLVRMCSRMLSCARRPGGARNLQPLIPLLRAWHRCRHRECDRAPSLRLREYCRP